MSVRPITVSEEIKAKGHPFVNILATLGGIQGLIMYLNGQRIPITQNWFSHPGSFKRFGFLVVGGYLVGGAVGMSIFADWEILRLRAKHQEDKQYLVESQRSDFYSR